MDELFVRVPAGSELASGGLSEAEQAAVQSRIWQLLTRQTSLYTMDDSSSVPVETAQELLSSILFTLDEALKARGESRRLLLSVPAGDLLNEGRQQIEAESGKVRQLWQTACLGIPNLKSDCLRETLQEIGRFWDRYDARYFAHQVPCVIDYPLCQPVSEDTQGIVYIHHYLRRIVTENRILSRFDGADAARLLANAAPGCEQLPLNLCEPVISCAVGLALLERAPYGLCITAEDRIRLAAIFEPLPEAKARAALRAAAERFCSKAGFRNPFTRSYVSETALELYPRIQAGLTAGNLSGVFPPSD